jgi:hypothetical protein
MGVEEPRRRVLRLRWDRHDKAWLVVRPGGRATRHRTKAEALEAGRRACRRIAAAGGLAQLVVRTRDGRIAFECTYGADPARHPG